MIVRWASAASRLAASRRSRDLRIEDACDSVLVLAFIAAPDGNKKLRRSRTSRRRCRHVDQRLECHCARGLSFGDLLDELLRNGSGVDVFQNLFGLDVGRLDVDLCNGRSVTVGTRRARPTVVTVATTTATLGHGALRVGQKSELTSSLDRVGDVALVLLAVARDLASTNFAAVRDVLAQLR